jgi:hypothetical protein
MRKLYSLTHYAYFAIINKKQILTDTQFKFRNSHSTIHQINPLVVLCKHSFWSGRRLCQIFSTRTPGSATMVLPARAPHPSTATA